MSTPALNTLRSAASMPDDVRDISVLVLAISVRSSSARLLGNGRSSVSVEDTARSSLDAVLACVWVVVTRLGRLDACEVRRLREGLPIGRRFEQIWG